MSRIDDTLNDVYAELTGTKDLSPAISGVDLDSIFDELSRTVREEYALATGGEGGLAVQKRIEDQAVTFTDGDLAAYRKVYPALRKLSDDDARQALATNAIGGVMQAPGPRAPSDAGVATNLVRGLREGALVAPGRAVANTLGTAAEALGVTRGPLAAQNFYDAAGRIADQNEDPRGVAGFVGTALGSTAPSAAAVLSGGGLPGILAYYGVQGFGGGVDEYREAMESQGRDTALVDQAVTGIGNAAAEVIFERLSIGALAPLSNKVAGRVADAVLRGSAKDVAAILGKVAQAAGVEASEEAITQVAQNIIAKDLVAFDPERSRLQGVPEAAAAGAIGGAGIAGGAIGIGGVRAARSASRGEPISAASFAEQQDAVRAQIAQVASASPEGQRVQAVATAFGVTEDQAAEMIAASFGHDASQPTQTTQESSATPDAAEAVQEPEQATIRRRLIDALPAEKRERLNTLLAEAREKFGGGTVSANAFLDPKNYLLAGKIGALYAEAGARSFADFTAAMVETFGEDVLPRIKDLYTTTRNRQKDAAGFETDEQIRAYTTEQVREFAQAPRRQQSVANAERLLDRALNETLSREKIGNPQRANVGVTTEQRRGIDTVDQIALDAGVIPQPRRADATVQAEAAAMTPEQVESLLARATVGQPVSDAEVAALNNALRGAVDAFVGSRAPEAANAAVRAGIAQRTAGSTTGRALRQFRDPLKTSGYDDLADLPQGSRVKQIVTREILAGPRRLRDSIAATQRRLADPDVTPEQQQSLEARLERLIQRNVRHAEKMMQRLRDAGFDLASIPDEKLANDAKVRSAILRMIEPSSPNPADWAYEFWINALLSAPTTQIVNATSNAIESFYMLGGGKLLQTVVAKTTGDPSAPTFAENLAAAKMAWTALGHAGRTAIQSFAYERPVFDDDITFAQLRRPQGGSGSKFDDYSRFYISIPGKAGGVIRTIGLRPLNAMDQFFKRFNGTLFAAEVAYRQERARGRSHADAMRLASERSIDLSDSVWSDIIEDVQRSTFQEQAGQVAELINKARGLKGIGWIARYTVPFVRTPANLFRRTVARSPLGVIQVGYKLARQGLVELNWDESGWSYDRKTFNRDAADALFGLGVGAAVYALLSGLDDDDLWITGAGSADPGERSLQYRTRPPYSIGIGGRVFNYQRLDPWATSLATMVDAVRAIDEAQESGDAEAAISGFFSKVAQNLKDRTFYKGISDLIDLAESVRRDRGGQGAAEFATNFAVSWVPNIIRSAGRSSDDALRQTRIWGATRDEILERATDRGAWLAFPFPGAQDAPPARYDLWGREISTRTFAEPTTDFAYRFLSPFTLREEPTEITLDRVILNWNLQNPREKYAPADPYPVSTRREGGRRRRFSLTDEEYATLTRDAGQLAVQRLRSYRFTPENPTAEQINVIRREVAEARRIVRDQIIQRRGR